VTIPFRGHTGFGTYFTTTNIWLKKHLLQSYRSAELCIEVLYEYRSQKKYLLHEFVVMPNHFHLLITPLRPVTLERGMGMIKGAFSYHASRQFGFPVDIWQPSFFDRRVRDSIEYERFRRYIHENPVKAHLATSPAEYPFGSATGKFELDEVPQRLKPRQRAAGTQA
jgi:putative transposase